MIIHRDPGVCYDPKGVLFDYVVVDPPLPSTPDEWIQCVDFPSDLGRCFYAPTGATLP